MAEITERNEHGQVVKAELSSEEGRALAAQRRTKEERQEASARRILAGFGVEWEKADELDRVLAMQAAGKSFWAAKFLKEKYKPSPDNSSQKLQPIEPGAPCPCCGRTGLEITIEVSEQAGRTLAEVVAEVLAERGQVLTASGRNGNGK